MGQPSGPGTDQLLDRVERGDHGARSQLLEQHRARLAALVALRMDRRLSPRLDPSDVVQEALLVANDRLPDFARHRSVPFYLWLRQLTLERLVEEHRRHIWAQRRSVRREEAEVSQLPEESMAQLAERLAGHASSPSARLRREDRDRAVRQTLARLPERDRELLTLRHLEQLSVREIASVLGISEGAAKVRHVRALDRLRCELDQSISEILS
jgi:RNA polymerase sigma-70 factor (ECF subfamily)